MKKIVSILVFLGVLNGIFFFYYRNIFIVQAQQRLGQINVQASIVTLDLPFFFIFKDQNIIKTIILVQGSYVPTSTSFLLAGNIIDGYYLQLTTEEHLKLVGSEFFKDIAKELIR